jgi:tRNA(Arg) A34 adenosine deaminase TadA
MMKRAIEQAELAGKQGEIPVGAVITDSTGKVIASTHNLTETCSDPTAHAELLAIREACRILGTPRLTSCNLYVTLEPCPMCAQAIAFARIRKLYFGAYDIKGGGVENGPRIFHQPTCHHKPEVIGGIEESLCAGLLKRFFADKR